MDNLPVQFEEKIHLSLGRESFLRRKIAASDQHPKNEASIMLLGNLEENNGNEKSAI